MIRWRFSVFLPKLAAGALFYHGAFIQYHNVIGNRPQPAVRFGCDEHRNATIRLLPYLLADPIRARSIECLERFVHDQGFGVGKQSYGESHFEDIDRSEIVEPDGEKILQFGHVNDPVKKRIRRSGPERLPTKIGSGRIIRGP